MIFCSVCVRSLESTLDKLSNISVRMSPITFKLGILVLLTLTDPVKCGEIDTENATHPVQLANLKTESPERDQGNAEQIKTGMSWNATVVLLTLALVGSLLLNLYQLRNNRKLSLLVKEHLESCFDDGNPSLGGLEATVEPCQREVYELSKDSFTIDESSKLGVGSFGMVCMGTITRNDDVERVAVKMVRNPYPTHPLRSLLYEIKGLSYLRNHPHIVEMKGAYIAELRRGIVLVFLELCELGTLLNFLRKARPVSRDSVEELNGSSNINGTSSSSPEAEGGGLAAALVNDMSRWSIEIARAMKFLASKGLVHCDIAARNVLLTGTKQAKLSNFGSSHLLEDDETYIKKEREPSPIPWRSMAPESLRSCQFTEKTDIWGFGIFLWEIYTLGDEPYSGQAFDYNFPQKIDKGLRLPKPTYNINYIYYVMLRCWAKYPENRPNFQELIRILNAHSTGEVMSLQG